MSESEFGNTVGDLHGGEIIQTPEGVLVFLSSAFNPLTIPQLRGIIRAMLNIEEQS